MGAGNAYRRRLPQRIGDLNANRADLDSDRMSGKLRLAEQPHQKDGDVEEGRFHNLRAGDRKS
jgi:hypothetical protein